MNAKDAMRREYPYTTELHAHTLPISSCSEFTAPELIALYREIGVDSVVLTNHLTQALLQNQDEKQAAEQYVACYRELEREAKKAGMNAIFGIELRFWVNWNDYLIYGVTPEETEEICTYIFRDIQAFYEGYKNQRNLIFQAHPFRDGMTPVDPRWLDGIEVFNMHPGHNSRVALAAAHARKHWMLICGGTDFHHPGHQGSCLMRTRERMEDSFQVARTLREKDFLLDIGRSLIMP